MSKLLIKDFKVGETVDTCLAVKQKSLSKTKKGDPYVSLKLSDKSGELDAKIWDNFADIYESISEDGFIRVYAEVVEFMGKPQLNIKKAKLAEKEEIDLKEFLPTTEKDIDKMFENVLGVARTVEDQDLKRLLDLFFSDKDFVSNFKMTPAAVSLHSACLGGLLEHVDQMLPLAEYIVKAYEGINRDLLITGVILHDIGKIRELSYETTLRYTDYGKLVGHFTIGCEMLNEKIREIDNFPEEKKMLLEHMILSHHGQPEWGSPRRPAILEAVVLHYIDNIDAKIVGFNDFVKKHQKDGTKWTPRSFMFDNSELYINNSK